MNGAGLKVHAIFNAVCGTMDIYLVEETAPDRRYIARHLDFTFDPLESGATPDPTFRLRFPLAQAFLRAMAEAATEAGQKPDAQSKVEGVLEATQDHLEDLRKLLGLHDGGPTRLEVKR